MARDKGQEGPGSPAADRVKHQTAIRWVAPYSGTSRLAGLRLRVSRSGRDRSTRAGPYCQAHRHNSRRLVVPWHVEQRLGGPNGPFGRAGIGSRFADESRITGRLQHLGLPAVFDVGTLGDGRPFLAMKPVKGRTPLAELLGERPAPRADRIPAFEQVRQAMAYAHSRRVIHRDLKPANVMVGAFGELQVMDGGLAKALDEETAAAPRDPQAAPNDTTQMHDAQTSLDGERTQPGAMLGTPAFMPQEQAAGAVGLIDERADVFGLGAVLGALLTGPTAPGCPPSRRPSASTPTSAWLTATWVIHTRRGQLREAAEAFRKGKAFLRAAA